MRLAQIESRRAHQVADVLDQQQAIVSQREFLHRMAHHVGIEMAALAGIDLHCGHAGGANTVSVEAGLLVALDHRDPGLVLEPLDSAGEQRGLAGTGTRHQVEREDAMLGEMAAVGRRVQIVLGENILLDPNQAGSRPVRMFMGMGFALDFRFAFTATAGCTHD